MSTFKRENLFEINDTENYIYINTLKCFCKFDKKYIYIYIHGVCNNFYFFFILVGTNTMYKFFQHDHINL